MSRNGIDGIVHSQLYDSGLIGRVALHSMVLIISAISRYEHDSIFHHDGTIWNFTSPSHLADCCPCIIARCSGLSFVIFIIITIIMVTCGHCVAMVFPESIKRVYSQSNEIEVSIAICDNQ
jgi:hypothetical protein